MADMNQTDLEVMQAAWLAEVEKIEAGIDWGIIPTDAGIE